MKKAAIVGTVIAASLLFVQEAQAQCGGAFGISVCGQIYVNTPVVTPAPIVVQQPQVVYTPPPVYTYTPPPQPVIVTQPAPVVYQQPAPIVVQTTQTYVPSPPPRMVLSRRPMVRHRGLGFGLRAGGGYAGMTDVANFGGGANIRYITSPRFGVEFTVDAFGGTGYTGNVERVEIPITLNGLWFINPRSRAQLYLLGGFGASFASVEANGYEDSPVYLGGELGLGVEFLIGRHVGLTMDVRGFLRGRVNERELPPSMAYSYDGSCREDGFGGWECTNLTAGATFNLGFNFYL